MCVCGECARCMCGMLIPVLCDFESYHSDRDTSVHNRLGLFKEFHLRFVEK